MGDWAGLVKKLNVTPKEKKAKKNNLCKTRPALLVKIRILPKYMANADF